MSLDRLSFEIVRLTQVGRTTPVLVTEPFLSFRDEFFRQWVISLANHTERTIRIDWLRTGQGIRAAIGDRLSIRKAARITRSLHKIGNANHSVQIAVSIGRPAMKSSDDLTIGLASTDQTLPSWATPIPLIRRPILSPQHPENFHHEAA